MHIRTISFYSEGVIMYNQTVWLIKINNLNLRTPIFIGVCKNFPCIRTVTFLNTWSNGITEDFCPLGRYLIGKSLKDIQINSGKKPYFCNTKTTKMSALFRIPYQSNTSPKDKSPPLFHCSKY